MSLNRMTHVTRGVAVLAVVAGCHSLEIANPNEPDKNRALSDPAAIEAIASGAIRTWFIAWTPLRSAGTMSMQARSFSSSWNNGNNNFYSGIDIPPSDEATPPDQWSRATRSWQNDPSAAARTSVEGSWGGGLDEGSISRGGFYSALSSTNDALYAIRTNNVLIGDAAQTKRAETVAAWMQGAALMGIALNFDKGYIVDESTDLKALQYSDRKAMRDAAVAKLTAAAALAAANTFDTPDTWTNGIAYSNAQIARIANTMAAMTLAWYARDDGENAATNWTQVQTLSAQGMTQAETFSTVGDGCVAWCHETLAWMNAMDTGRLWTRVAHFMDPATQKDPYPLATGNPQPNSPDRRLGNGTFGVASMVGGFGNIPKTTGAGTDFAYSSQAIFRPDRGFYHQSNIGHIRYDLSGIQNPATSIYGGFGPAPAINGTLNALLRAEASLRLGGAANVLLAAQLVNQTRVTRGGLSDATTFVGNVGAPSDGPCMADDRLAKTGGACTLWSLLLYENEIELLGLGASPFYNQRHLPNVVGGGAWDTNSPRARYIQGLLPGTPREMPVPAKELGVKNEALYTFGGASPDKSTPP